MRINLLKLRIYGELSPEVIAQFLLSTTSGSGIYVYITLSNSASRPLDTWTIRGRTTDDAQHDGHNIRS
jgi:hypothetical protein